MSTGDYRPPAEDPWWDYAHNCATALAAGKEAPEQPVYGPLLMPGEVARLQADASYSRLQAGASTHRPASAPVLATRPAMMLASMAAQSVINRRRERQEARDAAVIWQPPRTAEVLTTTARIMCRREDGAWNSFWYQDMCDYHPDLSARTLTMGFAENQCAPVRLSGPAVPAIALWSASAIYGSRWQDDPRLRALTTPSPAQQQRNQAAAQRWAADHAHQRAQTRDHTRDVSYLSR